VSAAVTAAPADEPTDGLPVVADRSSRDMGLWIFMAILLLGGVTLFAMLSAQRDTLSAPRTTAVTPDPSSRISSPPPLALPEDPYGGEYRLRYLPPRTMAPGMVRPIVPAPPPQVSVAPPQAARTAYSPAPQDSEPAPYRSPLPAVVYDGGRSVTQPANTMTAERDRDERVTAGRFANPALTVPQGVVIPAVLETALDSTRPGAVRALVSRDVRGFDGSRVLIGRGSRLYGEYGAEVGAGQKRALIRWTRLIRPDGVTIALDSPAADPLGRAGVKGRLDSKFFARFGGALLQTVLDIGVGVATREATDGVIVALPGSTQNVTPRIEQQQVQPTLTVRHGTSVSVFVARDLDFSTVDS
jgi:type IV secretion system protein VirB10